MDPTPAQIVNDMVAHAAYWQKRDRYVARTCEIAAMVIRGFLDGAPVDGRTFNGLHVRVLNLTGAGRGRLSGYQGAPNLGRAMACAFELRNAASMEARP